MRLLGKLSDNKGGQGPPIFHEERGLTKREQDMLAAVLDYSKGLTLCYRDPDNPELIHVKRHLPGTVLVRYDDSDPEQRRLANELGIAAAQGGHKLYNLPSTPHTSRELASQIEGPVDASYQLTIDYEGQPQLQLTDTRGERNRVYAEAITESGVRPMQPIEYHTPETLQPEQVEQHARALIGGMRTPDRRVDGVGTNVQALFTGDPLVDEKIIGVHAAFGRNDHMGGRTVCGPHVDFIKKMAGAGGRVYAIDADGEETLIMDDGEPVGLVEWRQQRS